MTKKRHLSVVFILLYVSFFQFSRVQENPEELTDDQKILQALHSISSHTLFDYVIELASDKYEGRMQPLFVAVLDMANQNVLDFRN